MTAVLDLPEKARELFVEETIPDELGWIDWLSAENLVAFKNELFDAMQRKMTPDEVDEFIDGWIATAELDHSPDALAQIERNRRSSRWASVDEWMSRKSDIG